MNYILTTPRLKILVKSHHLAIKSVAVEELYYHAIVTIKLRWWFNKKKFIKTTLPEIVDTIEMIRPLTVKIEYKVT